MWMNIFVYYFRHAGRQPQNNRADQQRRHSEFRSSTADRRYVPLPIEASGFEYKGDGGLPRPTIRLLPTSTATLVSCAAWRNLQTRLAMI